MSEEQKACKQKTQTGMRLAVKLHELEDKNQREFLRAVRKVLEDALKEKVTCTRIVNDPEWVIRIIRVDKEGGVSTLTLEAVFIGVKPFATGAFLHLNLIVMDDKGFLGRASVNYGNSTNEIYVTVGSLPPSTHPVKLDLTFNDAMFRL